MIHRIPSAPRRGRQGAPFAVLAALFALGLAACEFPTEIPKWDTTWVVPADSTSIGVAEFLPSAVTTGSGGSSFVLALPSVTVSRTLGEICGAPCTAANGATVPKPGFETTLGSTVSLPIDVLAAQVTGGSVQVALSHNFAFDPIRPSASARGFILVTATVGSTVIARDSIAGQATAFGSGSTLNRTLTLSGARVTGPIAINVTLNSPAGDAVAINTANGLSFTATPTQIGISQAQVRVENRFVDAAEVELDLADIDETVSDNAKSGALILTLTNPFAVNGKISLVITTPGTTVTRDVTLAQGSTTTRVEFDEQEIRSILGASVRLRATGSVCSTGACTTDVTPSQSVAIASRLELTIGPKEN